MKAAICKAGRGLHWYLKQATGESKWDDYLERCRRDGTDPLSRRQFERQRAEQHEKHPQARCC